MANDHYSDQQESSSDFDIDVSSSDAGDEDACDKPTTKRNSSDAVDGDARDSWAAKPKRSRVDSQAAPQGQQHKHAQAQVPASPTPLDQDTWTRRARLCGFEDPDFLRRMVWLNLPPIVTPRTNSIHGCKPYPIVCSPNQTELLYTALYICSCIWGSVHGSIHGSVLYLARRY